LNPDSWLEILMHAGLDDTHMVARRIYPVKRSFLRGAGRCAALGADIILCTVRTGIIEPHARTLELPLIVRSSSLFLFLLS